MTSPPCAAGPERRLAGRSPLRNRRKRTTSVDNERGVGQAPPRGPIRRAARSPSAIPRDDPVTTLKLHYDGWLALPAALRRKLGLGNGAALEVELVDAPVVRRPSREGRGSAAWRGREPTEPSVGPASAAAFSPRADTPAARK